jgi:XTP/dITP diphosphohydrolase
LSSSRSGRSRASARLPGARPRRLAIATGNAGKLREYKQLLSESGFELVPHSSGVDEVGANYAANALLKAAAASHELGLPALGDDAGIEVEALGGFPGLGSARLAPTQPERTAELLRRLAGHPRPWRARFVCAIALTDTTGATTISHGERWGEVIPDWRGGVGFGYDPIFLVPEAGKTFGEMSAEEKHAWSHRGAAVRALLQTGVLARVAAESA